MEFGQTTSNLRTRENPLRPRSEGIFAAGLLGNFSNHLQANQLRTLVRLVETTPPRQPGATAVQPRRLDHRFTPAAIAEIVAFYESGSSTNQLCKQYGLSKGSLLKILDEHGVKTRFQPMTPGEIAHAAALDEAGDSLKTIAGSSGKQREASGKLCTNKASQYAHRLGRQHNLKLSVCLRGRVRHQNAAQQCQRGQGQF